MQSYIGLVSCLQVVKSVHLYPGGGIPCESHGTLSERVEKFGTAQNVEEQR